MTGAALASGWSGLALGYATVQVSLLAGLIRGKALWHQYLLSPLAAAPLTFAAGLGISLTGFWMQGPMLGAAI